MRQRYVTALVALLVGGAFALSCQIQARTPAQHPTGQRSAAARLLGESRMGISGYFYEMADLYFHRGVAHIHTEAIHDTWFQRRRSELKPSVHVHATGEAAREVLPWLRLAIAMNPHNVDFVLVAAFWLQHEVGANELAQQLLKDAQITNPFHYEIQLERARLYLYRGRVADARDRLDAALAFWPSPRTATDADVLYDRARILLYRSLIHEVDDERAEAIAGLREILRIFPERTSLLDRIKTLEEGKEPALLGAAVWNNLLQSEDERSMLCDTDEADHHDHDAHCHH